jgi:ribosomal-protein-alanine N-acetyltransferase
VDKEYRRSGVGRGLIQAVEDEFLTDALERVTLEVRKSNWGARRFYETQGYKPLYIVKGYYADGEDAVVYEKRI